MHNQTSPPQPLYNAIPAGDYDRVVNWLPLEVKTVLRRFPQLFIAGGWVRAMLAKEGPKDIDIFTTDLSVLNLLFDCVSILPCSAYLLLPLCKPKTKGAEIPLKV